MTYTRDQAIAILGTPVARDKTYTLASQLIAALLNVRIGNDPTCIEAIIDDAQAWLTSHPVGSDVRGSSPAWRTGDALSQELDAYNNGEICWAAPRLSAMSVGCG